MNVYILSVGKVAEYSDIIDVFDALIKARKAGDELAKDRDWQKWNGWCRDPGDIAWYRMGLDSQQDYICIEKRKVN